MSVVTDCGKSVKRTKYCVLKCKYDDEEYENISFHSFPTDEQRRKLWIEAANKKDWMPAKSAKLCSLHFESRYIERFHGKATLRHLAIPTIFDNYDKHKKKLNYTNQTEIEIIDVDIKSENGDAEDSPQCSDEKLYAEPIDIIDEEFNNQYRSIDYQEPTPTILMDLESCCRLCLGALTTFDIQFLSVLKYDEIPINFKELNISIDDGLPQRICENCCQVFEVIKIFMQQARRSQEFLRKHIEIQIDPVDNITEDLPNETEPNVSDAETVDNSEAKEVVDPDRHCEICDKTFAQKVYKMSHMELLHTNNTYECDFCGSRYKTREYIKKHILRNHSTMTRTCPKCNATFTNPYRYRYHLKTHNPNKKFKCLYCEKSFLQQHHLSNHENAHTAYLCILCGESFRDEQQYKSHISNHKNRTTLDNITVAQHEFRTKRSLKPRRRWHTGETSIQCRYCHKSFATHASLIVHNMKHADLKIVTGNT